MKIDELARRTGVPTRMLLTYEEQGLLHPARTDSGGRHYPEGSVRRVQRICGLLDSGLTTEAICRILPFLDRPDDFDPHPQPLTPELSGLLTAEADRIQQRIECLNRNRDAIHAYLRTVRRADRGDDTALANLLARATTGHPPGPDGGLTILPQPSPRDLGVLAFTGHIVIFADLDPGWICHQLPDDDLSAPLNPPFLRALEEETGRRVDNVDLLMYATPLDGPPPLPLARVTDAAHPRIVRARRHRDEVQVWQAPEGLVILGRGVAGRWEVAVEVESGQRGRGTGRLLAGAARHLSPGPLWAQIAPGNAASVRAFLAAGYLPMAAEALLSPPS